MGPRGKEPGLAYEFSYTAQLKPPVACAPGHNGTRFFVEATEGRVEGERLSGTLSGGGDWLLAGSDGWGRLDVRTHITTDDGAFIYVQYGGILELNETVMTAVFTGGSTEFEDQYFRTKPVFETGDERYSWLTRSVFVGQGHFAGDGVVEYDVYRVT
jgi:hypothetical protein